MKLLDNISRFYKNLFRRRRISVINTTNRHEEWFTHMSPVGMVTLILSTIIFIFATLLLLSGYTTILNIFPEYRNQSERSRHELVESMFRIDSIENELLNMAAFSRNISLIMDGNSPITYSTVQGDTVAFSAGHLAPNNLDSLLRSQMDSSQRYSLNYPTASQIESKQSLINYTQPIDGIVTEAYDIANGNYGVRVASQPSAMIYASDSGIVVNSLWSPEDGHIIEIIHPKGDLTIYKGVSRALFSKGDGVKRGEVIGYSSIDSDSNSGLFTFELWIAGKPVNPQHYINF